jgi:hypothetical protein
MREVYRLAPIRPGTPSRAPIFGSLIERGCITLNGQNVRVGFTLNLPRSRTGSSVFDAYFMSKTNTPPD